MSGAATTTQTTSAAAPAPAAGASGAAAAPASATTTPPATDGAPAAGAAPTGGAAPAAGAPGAAPSGQQAAPADLQIKLPEGFAPDEKLLGQFKAIAGELKLDATAAEKMAAFWAATDKAQLDARVAQADAIRGKWADALKSDKELSAAGFREAAQQGMRKFATPELAKFLEETGLGDHPELVRIFGRIGKLAAEDSLAGGAGAAPTRNADESFLAQMYDHPTSKAMFKKE